MKLAVFGTGCLGLVAARAADAQYDRRIIGQST